ncbi:MAG: DUF5916 domain-containing protein, partial [Bacteroidota bacterium]
MLLVISTSKLMNKWRLSLCFFALLVTNFAQAQQDDNNFPPPEDPIEIVVSKATSKITLDGKLEESDWTRADPVSDFFRREPRQGGPVRYETQVKFLYDDRFLYIGAFCKDSVGLKGIRIQNLRRDFGFGNNDVFGIALDPQNLKQYAQAFQTTPYGNQSDFQNFGGNEYDGGWNTLWQVRTQRRSDGYTVEMAIPFKTLRYDKPKNGEPVTWGVTLVRNARRDIEVTSFPAIPQSFSPYRMTYAAKLTGIEVPLPSANIRVEPFSLFQYENDNQLDNEISEADVKVGGDIKWALNPRSVLDFTFNTDFAQADVDRAVNNLERFNIFFPERRQFFLENSGIWAGSAQRAIRPFFSRRIGLQGEFNANPAPIHIGTRFTQRTEKQAIAGLFVRQGGTENSPVSNFGVARYLRNFGQENNVGIMLTHRLDEASEDLDLEANNNTTITVDGRLRPTETWDIQYLWSSSFDEASGETGHAGRISVSQRSNHLYAGWSTEFIDSQYNPGMGFIRQSDLLSHNPGAYYIWRPKKIPWIRRWDPGAFGTYNHDASDPTSFQQASLYIFPVYIWFKDDSFFEFSFTPTWQNINFDFAPLGLPIAQDEYFYTRFFLMYYTDQSKKWSAFVSNDFGAFYDGRRNTLFVSGRLAPIPHINFTASYERNDLRDMGLENQDLTTNLYTLGARFALNPRLQLSAFYQYNSFDDLGRWNVRMSWEYKPLSFVYLVYNNNLVQEEFDR